MGLNDPLLELKSCYDDLDRLEVPRLTGDLEFEGDADVDMHHEAGDICGLAARFLGRRSVESVLESIKEIKVIKVDSTIGSRMARAHCSTDVEKERLEQFLVYDRKVKALAKVVSRVSGKPVQG